MTEAQSVPDSKALLEVAGLRTWFPIRKGVGAGRGMINVIVGTGWSIRPWTASAASVVT